MRNSIEVSDSSIIKRLIVRKGLERMPRITLVCSSNPLGDKSLNRHSHFRRYD